MPAELYFEIQYFNFDWKITIILLHSHRNTQQWQVRLKSVLFSVRISNSNNVPIQQFISVIAKKNSVHVIGRHNVTATVGKTPLCKIWKPTDAKKLFYVHLNSVVLGFSEF